MIIAIDGSAASGKGTLAKGLAQHLDYDYLDTGALYRAVALSLLNNGMDENNISENQAVKCASSVIAAYSDQSLSQINMDQSAMESTTQHFEISDQRARGLLAAAGLSMAHQNRKITTLSGGQKARLALLLLRLKTPNFYLLDEPTNHLDIDDQEALEEELISHRLPCLIVTHDRSFLRNIGTRFWWIEHGKLQEYDSPEPFLGAEMDAG